MRIESRPGRAASLVQLVLALIPVLGASCSGTPTLDERLREERRDYPQLAPVEGVRDTRLDSAAAMFAAAELIRGSAPYYARFTDLDFDSLKSQEAEAAITIDALWLARYNVETLDWISGMGIPLPDADARLTALIQASNLKAPPIRNPLPIYLPFASGDPHFTRKIDLGDPTAGTPPDAATMRFDPARMDTSLRPDSIAHTLWAEVELGRVLLSGTHPIDDAGQVLRPGKSREDFFEGLLLLTLASEKARALRESFLISGGFGESVSLSWSGIRGLIGPRNQLPFLPHRFALEGGPGPGAPLRLRIVEPVSYLGDLAAVLLAASELCAASDPSAENPLASLFASGGPMPPSTHDTARALAAGALNSILLVHADPSRKAPVSHVSLDERGTSLKTADAALLALALKSYRAHVEAGGAGVESLERQLGGFLLGAQYDDGCYTTAYDVESLDAVEPRNFSATVQGMAIRGLLVAFDTSGDFLYRRAAVRTQRYLDDRLWAFDQRLYRSEEVIASGTKYSRYRPPLVGAVAAGLRELSIATRDGAYAARYVEFINGVTLRSGLLQSELGPTGETSATEPDQDKDGIRNSPFADGPFGVAPVFAAEVIHAIP